MVQNGKLAAWALAFTQIALNSVDCKSHNRCQQPTQHFGVQQEAGNLLLLEKYQLYTHSL